MKISGVGDPAVHRCVRTLPISCHWAMFPPSRFGIMFAASSFSWRLRRARFGRAQRRGQSSRVVRISRDL